MTKTLDKKHYKINAALAALSIFAALPMAKAKAADSAVSTIAMESVHMNTNFQIAVAACQTASKNGISGELACSYALKTLDKLYGNSPEFATGFAHKLIIAGEAIASSQYVHPAFMVGSEVRTMDIPDVQYVSHVPHYKHHKKHLGNTHEQLVAAANGLVQKVEGVIKNISPTVSSAFQNSQILMTKAMSVVPQVAIATSNLVMSGVASASAIAQNMDRITPVTGKAAPVSVQHNSAPAAAKTAPVEAKTVSAATTTSHVAAPALSFNSWDKQSPVAAQPVNAYSTNINPFDAKWGQGSVIRANGKALSWRPSAAQSSVEWLKTVSIPVAKVTKIAQLKNPAPLTVNPDAPQTPTSLFFVAMAVVCSGIVGAVIKLSLDHKALGKETPIKGNGLPRTAHPEKIEPINLENERMKAERKAMAAMEASSAKTLLSIDGILQSYNVGLNAHAIHKLVQEFGLSGDRKAAEACRELGWILVHNGATEADRKYGRKLRSYGYNLQRQVTAGEEAPTPVRDAVSNIVGRAGKFLHNLAPART